MQTEPQVSWLREFLFPALFLIIGAVLGAVLTYFTGRLSDNRKAKRAKESFLRAIGMELDALGTQLDASLQEVKDSTARVTRGAGAAPHFAAALRTSVFTSQLGKLQDVDDPLLIAVVHFYSDLGTLEQTFESVNDIGAEYNRAHVPSGEKEGIRPQVMSGLIVIQQQITGFSSRLRTLRTKLPPAEIPPKSNT